MPRNNAGSYTLPSGSPYVTGTTISSTVVNSVNSDVAVELTNSLDRNGRGQMLAPLPLSDGSVSAPALTFSSEPSSGLYRAGINDLRLAVGGNAVLRATAAGAFALLGLTITTTVTNGVGVTTTGNGTGAGLVGIGGSGGAPGVSGTGTIAAPGVAGTGGPSNGVGVSGQGTASGAGVAGVGGLSNGAGVTATGGGGGDGLTATGGPTDGTGVRGTGTGAGSGVVGTASGTGFGGYFTGGTTNGSAVFAQGTGTGAGVKAFVSSSAANAVEGVGAGTGAGVYAANSGSGPGLNVAAGHAKFSGGNPGSTSGFSNTITPKNIVKAWARFATNATSSPTVVDGFNVASVFITSTTTAQINFAAAMGDLSYMTMVSAGPTSGTGSYVVSWQGPQALTATTVQIVASVAGTSLTAPPGLGTTSGITFNIVVYGAQ